MAEFTLTPEFTFKSQQNFRTLKTPFESGADQVRAIWPKPKRRWTLQWKHATPSEAELLRAFYRDHFGPATSFTYTPPDNIPRPYLGPTLSQTTGGSLGARTVYAGYTWADSSDNETKISYIVPSLSVSTGYLLTVTPPDFPTGVDKAFVYCGNGPTGLYQQATAITTSGATWTEPTGGWSAAGSSEPSSNSLQETVTVRFAEDSLDVIKLNAQVYSMQVVIEEIL